jgi:hypothetical protein
MGIKQEEATKAEAEKQRQEMIAQGRDHLDAAQRVWDEAQIQVTELTKKQHHQMMIAVCSEELVRTWLERLAGMLNVPVTRMLVDETVVLAWADTDGDPVTDQDGKVLHPIRTFDDLTKTIISVPKEDTVQ